MAFMVQEIAEKIFQLNFSYFTLISLHILGSVVFSALQCTTFEALNIFTKLNE